ncbi:hypothetical protein HDU97_005190 [Phlyctochytrium planicorne]|nr:hypothetical protein HDU97_005190 [Phlyctochytrium planicorne]
MSLQDSRSPNAASPTSAMSAMLQMPSEILELFILFSGYDLVLTCKQFYRLGSNNLILSRLLLIEHRLATPSQFVFSSDIPQPLLYSQSSTNLLSNNAYNGSASITNLDQMSDERRPLQLHALVQDTRFNADLGLTIVKTLMDDLDYLETLSEYSCITGALTVIEYMYPLPSCARSPLGTKKMMDEALIQSALCNQHLVVRHMLQAGSDPSYSNYSALGMACKHGGEESVQELIKFGVDVNAHDGFALVWAARMGHASIAKILLDAGASVDCRGGLPLMWAAEHGKAEICQMLIDHQGGDTTLIHSQDDYCLRWASARGHMDVVEMLLNAACRPFWSLRRGGAVVSLGC